MKSIIEAVDLFAGAGGTSTGLVQAMEYLNMKINLVAINHNEYALETHKRNHPYAKHFLTEIENVKPSEAVPGGSLNILVASPECIYHSRALGGKPKNNQSRSSAWYLERWIKDLEVKNVLVENVPEFMDWGPLDQDGMPIKKRKGETFRLWIHMFRKHGYNVDWKVLNSADYGDPTSRKRLFVRAAINGNTISWPEPTHAKVGANGRKKWVGAKDIIDWSIKGTSIFDRKKPLSENTIKRIVAGMNRFGSPEMKPFIVLLEHSLLKPENRIRDIDMPLPTITGARGGAMAIAQPFLIPAEKQADKMQDEYGSLVIQERNHALIEPYLISYYGNGGSSQVSTPVPTISTRDRFALIQPKICADGTAYKLEILYRMLTPRELASAMSFPMNYTFVGNRTQTVKQIGNAVAVRVARSLILSMLNPGNNYFEVA